MSISDSDFVNFYQKPIATLSADGDDHMYFMVGYPEEGKMEEWYEKAIAALTRLGVSGLICCYDVEGDIAIALEDMFCNRRDNIWYRYLFNLTEFGTEVARKFHLDTDEENYWRVAFPDFREELERIFDEHGVGLDTDLPYAKLLSLDSD